MIDLFKKQSNRRGYAYIWTLRPETKNKEQFAALVISNLWDTKNLTYSNDTTQISLMLVEFDHKDKNTSATPPPHYKHILRYMWFDTANTMLRSTIFLNQSRESQMWIPNKIIEELEITSPHNNQKVKTVRSSCKLQSCPLRNTGFEVQRKWRPNPWKTMLS